MDCRIAQDRLLEADDAEGIASEVASHLHGCAVCAAFAAKLTRLDAAARALPPASVETSASARDAFLKQLQPQQPQPLLWQPKSRLRLRPHRDLRLTWPRLA